MVSVMCGRKVIDKKIALEEIDMLGLKKTANRLV